MTPSQDWTSGLPLCFYASRRPFRVMRRTCARPLATAFHPSVCPRGGTNTSHQESEGVGAMQATSPGHQASFPGWLVTLCLLHPSPCHLFKPPRVSCPGKPTWVQILQYRLLCVLQEPGVSIRSHLTSSVLRLFSNLLPCPLAQIRTQVALRLLSLAGGNPCPWSLFLFLQCQPLRLDPALELTGCLGPALRLLLSLHPGLSVDLKLQLA